MSNEINVPIPSRIYNAATGGHVTGAEDIDFGQKVKHLVKYDHSGNEVSFASQLSAQNTIYVIHDDFTLTADVTIPANCILEFDGGSISGAYTLTGSNTIINAGLVKIFNTDVTLAGSWNVAEAYPEWFGAISDNVNIDSRPAIQYCLNYFHNACLYGLEYYLKSFTSGNIMIVMEDGDTIKGLHKGSVWQACLRSTAANAKIVYINGPHCIIEDIAIRGAFEHGWDNNDESYGICADTQVGRIFIKNVQVRNCYYGYYLFIYTSTLIGCVSNRCGIGFSILGEQTSRGTSVTLLNCFAVNSYEYGYHFRFTTYSSLISCAGDQCGLHQGEHSYYFEGCQQINVTACGSEDCSNFVKINSCRFIKLENCLFVTNSGSNPNNDSASSKYIEVINRDSDNLIFENVRINSQSTLLGKLFIDTNREDGGVATLNNVFLDNATLIPGNNVLLNGGYLESLNINYTKYSHCGPWSKRPQFASGEQKGFVYFRTDDNLSFTWNGTTWVDATGTPV